MAKILKIGELLVQKKLITENQLQKALEIQKKTSTKIGEILRNEGFINNLDFFRNLAKQKKLKFIDLLNFDIDEDILLEADLQFYLEKNYVPFSFNSTTKIYYIAVCNLDEDLENFLKNKYQSIVIFITSPLDIKQTLNKNFKFTLTENAVTSLYKNRPESSARNLVFNTTEKKSLIFFLMLLCVSLSNADIFLSATWAINIFYFSTILFKIYFILSGLKKYKSSYKRNVEIKNLPVYSILIPLFKEKEITLGKLFSAIKNLDYDKNKLDVKLIVEQNDFKTINSIKKLKPPAYFEIIYVPYSLPQTKPKACNYALNFCKGEFVTIYDAEDIPEPQQLKKVLDIYNNDLSGEVGAVQANLTYYNNDENILTKFFTLEYYCWFRIMLRGLCRNKFPIPLGGTSNHFRTETLKKLYNWDPFNVTEDADLGIRLYFQNLKVEMVESTTYEESPISLGQWFKQRTRWIKGHMQTSLIACRDFKNKYKKLGFRNYLMLFYFLTAPLLVYLSMPIFSVYGFYHYYFDVLPSNLLTKFALLNILLTLVMHFVIAIYIVLKEKWYSKFFSAIIFGFYWLLHCIAAPVSLYELILKPFYWSKTEHGKSKFNN